VLFWLSWLCNEELTGEEREAARMDCIFPLAITYTVQKSGAPFDTLPATSAALNLLGRNFLEVQEFGINLCSHNIISLYSHPDC
jgi:hypothetical protein